MTTVHRAERRSIRLRDYDYAARGCYFVTICTQDKVCRFGTVVDDAMVHNPPGRMVHEALNEIGSWYPGADVDTWVVMPNHIHAIILLDDPLAVGPGPQDCPDPAGRRPRSFVIV